MRQLCLLVTLFFVVSCASVRVVPKDEQEYKKMVSAHIKSRLVLPKNLDENSQVEVTIKQFPNFEIFYFAITRSSGNDAYDIAVMKAIESSSPLPPIPIGASFQDFRKIKLKFKAK